MNALKTEKFLFCISLRSGTLITIWLFLLTHIVNFCIDLVSLQVLELVTFTRISVRVLQFITVVGLPFLCLLYFPAAAKDNCRIPANFLIFLKCFILYCGVLTIYMVTVIYTSIFSVPVSQFRSNAIYLAAVPSVIVLGAMVHCTAVVYSFYSSLPTTQRLIIRCINPKGNEGDYLEPDPIVLSFTNFEVNNRANTSSATPASATSKAPASMTSKIRSQKNNVELNNARNFVDNA